jgi:polyhydroxyalkanoate synthesis regulator protein
LSKPINRLQVEAAKSGETIENARELQASWDRSVMIRVPLLCVSMLAQIIALSGNLGASS